MLATYGAGFIMTETEGAGDEQARVYARGIAYGHAWRKHSHEFPGASQIDFERMIFETIVQPSERIELKDDRFVCWSNPYGIIVVVNPRAEDFGTACRPGPGRKYLYDLR